MKRYLEYFENEWPENIEELTAIENKPFVGYLNGGGVKYTVIPEPVVYDPYVTFTAEEDNSSIGLSRLSYNQILEYSTDTTTWAKMTTSTTITLSNIGDKVYIRGVLSVNNSSGNYTKFKMSGKISASGNCNALWNYEDLDAPLKNYCGWCMFSGCTSLISAPELPATELAYGCYRDMFNGCTSLISAPELPSTELAEYCYYQMFSNCTSLTTVPEILPATTLADYCYRAMFSFCPSITTTPELPATTLATECYYCMFNSCKSLTTAPALPATTLAESCYNSMFQICTSLTTAPELPATTLAESCYESMFKNCTSLTTAPELPATTLAKECYYNIFRGCSSINNITCLATDISASSCTYDWVKGVASTGTFIKHPDMNNWTTGTKGIPEGWTVVDYEE